MHVVKIRKYSVYVIIFIVEFLILYGYFIVLDKIKLSRYYFQMQQKSIYNIDYSLSKGYVDTFFLSVRDYIIWEGQEGKLIERKQRIEDLLRNNFLTSDAYYLSKALLDKDNRPFFLKNAMQSNDVYIKYIASVYYYILVSRQLSKALASSYQDWKENIDPKYRWILDLVDKPLFNIAKNYLLVSKLKDVAIKSPNPILSSICIAALIAVEYKDETFYSRFLSSNYPLLFVVCTVGLYVTSSSSQLKEHQKYSYFIFNKPDLYRYYSILLIVKYSKPSIYRFLLSSDVKDYKEHTICILMMIN
ncbi:MAG: hypothetical protein ABDH21_03225 [bacterium]